MEEATSREDGFLDDVGFRFSHNRFRQIMVYRKQIFYNNETKDGIAKNSSLFIVGIRLSRIFMIERSVGKRFQQDLSRP